jgi:uncharacterized protein
VKSDSCTIGIFAREPIAGKTKTRLIPLLGAEGAAQFHQRCIQAAVGTAQRAALGEVHLFVTPALQADSFFYTLSPNIKCMVQSGENLGARMHNAFVCALQNSQRMIIVGTDCPALNADHLHEVNSWLTQYDGVCFIPAEDGGYVLVAMSQPHAALFIGIDWGTENVMAQTRIAAKNAGIQIHEMPPLWDIDTPNDYLRLAEDAHYSGFLKVSHIPLK